MTLDGGALGDRPLPETAWRNMAAEIPGWDFEIVRSATPTSWPAASYVKHEPQMNIFQSEAAVSELQVPYVGMDRAHSIGCSWWGAIEYWGESNKWPKKGWNYSVFSHTLEPYPSAYLLKSVISDTPVVSIAVETGRGASEEWNDVQVGVRAEKSAWEGRSGEVKKVRVYTSDIAAKNAKDGSILAVFRAGTVPGEAKIAIAPEGLSPVELKVEVGRQAR